MSMAIYLINMFHRCPDIYLFMIYVHGYVHRYILIGLYVHRYMSIDISS